MKKRIVLLAIGFAITVTLGWLDHEEQSIVHMFSVENVPAIVIYTAVLCMILSLLSRAMTGIGRRFAPGL